MSPRSWRADLLQYAAETITNQGEHDDNLPFCATAIVGVAMTPSRSPAPPGKLTYDVECLSGATIQHGKSFALHALIDGLERLVADLRAAARNVPPTTTIGETVTVALAPRKQSERD